MIILTISALILILLLRTYVRLKRPFAIDSDTFFHLELANHIKKNKFHFQTKHPRFILPGESDYPFLFHYFVALFPKNFHLKLEKYVSSILDFIHSLILLFFLYFDPINLNLSKGQIAFLVILHATSPNFLSKQVGPRAYQATPRVMSELIYFLYFISLVAYFNLFEVKYLWLSILFGAALLLTSKFGAQVLFLFSLIHLILTFNPIILVILISSFFFAIAFSKGYYLKVLEGQISHLNIYRTHLVKVHPQFEKKSLKNFTRRGTKSKLIFERTKLLKHNTMLGKMLYNIPILLASLIAFSKIDASALNPIIGATFISGLTIATLTSTKKLLFLGEGVRYLDYCVFSTYLYIVLFFSSDTIITILFYQITIGIYSGFMFMKTRVNSKYYHEQYLIPLLDSISNYPKNLTVFPIWPSAPWELIYRLKNPIFYTFSINKKYWPDDSYQKTFPKYPHIEPKLLQVFDTKYGLDLILIHKPTLKLIEKSIGPYNFDSFHNIYENRFYILKLNKVANQNAP